MHTIKVVMPPFGDEHGFPKPVPSFKTKNEFRRWMGNNGYPQHLIDSGQLDFCKYLYMEWEVDEGN